MSRYGSTESYRHRVIKRREGEFLVSWVYDRYYPGQRGRYPQLRQRDTDLAGARRFMKKWKLRAYWANGHVVDGLPEAEEKLDGLEVLRTVLKRLRSDDQGGYISYEGNGKWSFVSTSLPQTTPEELNALFELAGIVPDVIVPKGSCEDCANAKVLPDGRRVERGYAGPCSPCKRPIMSNFVPITKKRRTA